MKTINTLITAVTVMSSLNLMADLGYGNGQNNDDAYRGGRDVRQERVVLRINDQFRGRNSRIKLKQQLRRQTGMRAADYILKGVRVVAKSKRGQGMVSLEVAGYSQDSRTVMGNHDDFDTNRPYTYDRINLRNYDKYQQGPWQLRLDGNIKVKKIVLKLIQKRRGRGGYDDGRRNPRRRRGGQGRGDGNHDVNDGGDHRQDSGNGGSGQRRRRQRR